MKNIKEYEDKPYELLKDNNLLNIPVDIETLAKKIGIEVTYENLKKDLSGLIKYDSKTQKTEIVINKKQDYKPRQRFTIAHEIAHYIHDIDFSKSSEIEDNISATTHFRTEPNNLIEKKADKFAENLLMPKEFFEKSVNLIKDELFTYKDSFDVSEIYQIVEKLSKVFDVSRPAVIHRLKSLNIIDEEAKERLFDYHYNY